ncbi:MAG: DUF4738 domain-containing protein [Mediterranea sp.]|jgi:hypothetical protein|nr:DUF4738 domain-containing protein [Mediterranea sp.]
MKKRIHIGMLLAIMGIVACTNNKNAARNGDIRVLLRDSIDSHGIQRMQVSKVEQAITFKGKKYKSFVQRTPSDSLPRVKNDMGEVFVDNTIILRLTRGSEKIFDKTFTKQSFSSLVNAEFMKHAILEGMVFDKTTPQGLVYAVSISYPQTDLYIPVSVTITPDGQLSMVKEDLMEEVYAEEE